MKSYVISLKRFIPCIVSIRKIHKAEKNEQESMEQLRQMNMNIIRSLSYAIDAKDRYTRGHSQRVAEYSLMIAKRMGKSEEEQEVIYRAGLLHDVGKIRVPEYVINKPGKLTDEDKEYKMCQRESEEKNILVVDDEIMNIKMVGRIFRDIPTVHILSAMNRDETMSELANNDIDMILLDLRMPDIDGFELYGLIREKYNTPVVIMTADNSSETLEKINELGIGDYLTKPLNKFVTQEMVYGIINYRKNDI